MRNYHVLVWVGMLIEKIEKKKAKLKHLRKLIGKTHMGM